MSIPPSSASSSASQFTYTANSYYSAPYQPPQRFVAPSPAPAPPVAPVPGDTVYPQPIGSCAKNSPLNGKSICNS
ncbi:hypothetical protein Bca52824_041837 [Brassica carinata]|uniref:Uncharacterized protein n=1 Tax=Brassica carinata TaxID=52824 RepID=A0A8X7RW85_BRACI|nr:hypothetical protein Bca52824_041837 [Brassica carinata]